MFYFRVAGCVACACIVIALHLFGTLSIAGACMTKICPKVMVWAYISSPFCMLGSQCTAAACKTKNIHKHLNFCCFTPSVL